MTAMTIRAAGHTTPIATADQPDGSSSDAAHSFATVLQDSTRQGRVGDASAKSDQRSDTDTDTDTDTLATAHPKKPSDHPGDSVGKPQTPSLSDQALAALAAPIAPVAPVAPAPIVNAATLQLPQQTARSGSDQDGAAAGSDTALAASALAATGASTSVSSPAAATLAAQASPLATTPAQLGPPSTSTTDPAAKQDPDGAGTVAGAGDVTSTMSSVAANTLGAPTVSRPSPPPSVPTADSVSELGSSSLRPAGTTHSPSRSPDGSSDRGDTQDQAPTTPTTAAASATNSAAPLVASVQPSASAAVPVYTSTGDLPQQIAGPVLNLRASGDGSHRIVIQLHPQDLGSVGIEVTIREGAMSVSVASASESTRAVIAAALPALYQQLADAGISGVKVAIDQSNAYSSGGGASGGQQNQQQWLADQSRTARTPSMASLSAGSASTDEPPAPARTRHLSTTGVDRWL